MKPLHVVGMQGLGDNIHQRAVIRELVKTREVWLETPWPCFYFDIREAWLVKSESQLRTQAKNLKRQAHWFDADKAPPAIESMRVSYPPEAVRRWGSVLGAMSDRCGVPVGDFRMQVPAEWIAKARAHLPAVDRRILVARPLVARSEWGGAAVRNAAPAHYTRLFEDMRHDFFVVSVADIEPPQEELVGELAADLKLHRGELDAEAMVGLFAMASMVYTSSGFAVPLAQAVGTPVVSVFGGYESSWSFSAGARFSPYLGIDTVRPCACFSHYHQCERRIDEVKAAADIKSFVQRVGHARI